MKIDKSNIRSIISMQSLETLKIAKGLHLKEIVYEFIPTSTSLVLLDVGKCFIEAYNDVALIREEEYSDEVSRLAFRKAGAPVSEYFYFPPPESEYKPIKYQHKEYNKRIRDIAIIHDHVDIIDSVDSYRTIYDTTPVVILHFEDSTSLLIAVGSELAESLEIYDGMDELSNYLDILRLHRIDLDDEEYHWQPVEIRREIIPIEEYDPDKYAVE